MPTSVDPNQKAFAERLRHLERAHMRGKAFHAAGTYKPEPISSARRVLNILGRVLRLVLVIGVLSWITKGIILFGIGQEVYLQRVQALTETGSDFDRLAAWLMAPDGATQMIAAFLVEAFPKRP